MFKIKAKELPCAESWTHTDGERLFTTGTIPIQTHTKPWCLFIFIYVIDASAIQIWGRGGEREEAHHVHAHDDKLYIAGWVDRFRDEEHWRSPPPSSSGTRSSVPCSSRTCRCRVRPSAHPAGGRPREALFQEHHPAGGRRRRGSAGAAPAPKPLPRGWVAGVRQW